MSTKELLESEGLVVAQKGDWQKWWHYAVPFFFFIVGLVSKETRRSFYDEYYTAFDGTLYVPDLEEFWKNIDSFEYESLIRHELTHIYDDRKNPVWFKLSYIFSRKWRAYWEYRGYTQDIITQYERIGRITKPLEYRLIRIFRSPMYLWMDPNPEEMIDHLIEKVKAGDLRGEYPSAELDEILVPYRKTGKVQKEKDLS